MKLRALVTAKPLLIGTLVLAALPVGAALAAGPNLIRDGGFERPMIATPFKTLATGQSIRTCTGGARNCWLVVAGSANLTGSLWQAQSGNQSVELNGGAPKGEIEQAFSTVPGTQYKITFRLSSDPAATDNVGLRVSWEDIDGHGDTTGGVQQDFTYFDPTHTAINMHWVKHSFTVQATDVEGRLFLENTSGLADPDTGPAIDMVSVKPV